MQDFQQRKKIRKIIYSRNSVIALAVLTVFIAHGAIKVVQKQIESNKNLEIAQKDLSVVKERNENLSKNIALLQTKAGVESEIRQKYSVSKEGEEVAVIVQSPATATPVVARERGIWDKISLWFSTLF